MAHGKIGSRRTPKDAVVHMEVAGAGRVRDADSTAIELGIPNPGVECVEIPEGDAGARVPQKPRTNDAGFGEPMTLEAAVDAILHIHEYIVPVLVPRIEMRLRVVVRLIDGDGCPPPSVEGKADEAR